MEIIQKLDENDEIGRNLHQVDISLNLGLQMLAVCRVSG